MLGLRRARTFVTSGAFPPRPNTAPSSGHQEGIPPLEALPQGAVSVAPEPTSHPVSPESTYSYGIEQFQGSDQAEVDIVFIHGLNGHRTNTWSKDGFFWPASLLLGDVPKARILNFGYDASVVPTNQANLTHNTIEEHAEKLCTFLACHRVKTETTERPIIFVAHSFGGLICAQAMVKSTRAATVDDSQVIAKHTAGMLFFGTPFGGSKLACGADMSKKLGALSDAFADFLRKRTNSSSDSRKIEVVFFIEELQTQGTMVVKPAAACIANVGKNIRIRANHREICRFGNSDEEGYTFFLTELKRIISGIDNTAEEPERKGFWLYNHGKIANQIQGHHTRFDHQIVNL